MVETVKFSDFASGGVIGNGDEVVGFANGINYRFTTQEGSLPFIVGEDAQYQTIQAAIDAAQLVTSQSSPQLVLVNPGVYIEDVILYPFISLSSFSGSGKNSVIIRGEFSITATNPDDIFNMSGITFESTSGNPAFSIKGIIINRVELTNCFFVGANGPAFQNLNPNCASYGFNCELQALPGNKCFDIQGGQTYWASSFVMGSDVPSTIDSPCQMNFISGFCNDSFIMTNQAQMGILSNVIQSLDGFPAFSNIDGTTLVVALNPTIISNNTSGYWIEGGNILLTSQACIAGSAQNIDPSTNIIAQPFFVSTIRLMQQQTSLDLNNNFINNLLDPINDQDAATKKYVDDAISNVNPDNFVYVNTSFQQLESNKNYIVDNPTNVSLPLPLTSSRFDTINIQNIGGGLFSIEQSDSPTQSIIFGTSETTPGSTGAIRSTQQYSSITIICVEDNVRWSVFNQPIGMYDVD